MYDKILLPTDGSDISMAAAERAVRLASLAGSPLHAVYVREPYPYAGIGAASSAALLEYEAATQQQAEAAFARVAALAQAQGVSLSTATDEGSDPAEHIVAVAKDCGADLIVMGSHGRSGVARVLLGSVAGKVLMLSQVPVMIVK
jgi:nucleotide-binding universal stress UspA family protein